MTTVPTVLLGSVCPGGGFADQQSNTEDQFDLDDTESTRYTFVQTCSETLTKCGCLKTAWRNAL